MKQLRPKEEPAANQQAQHLPPPTAQQNILPGSVEEAASALTAVKDPKDDSASSKTGPRVVSVSRSGSISSTGSDMSSNSSDDEEEDSSPSSLLVNGLPRVTKYSHKLAERRRRREMKNVFDQLNDLLPLTDGKRSKWDVLVDVHNFIEELLATQKIYKEERERLRTEIEALGKSHK